MTTRVHGMRGMHEKLSGALDRLRAFEVGSVGYSYQPPGRATCATGAVMPPSRWTWSPCLFRLLSHTLTRKDVHTYVASNSHSCRTWTKDPSLVHLLWKGMNNGPLTDWKKYYYFSVRLEILSLIGCFGCF